MPRGSRMFGMYEFVSVLIMGGAVAQRALMSACPVLAASAKPVP
jgi:hypothetical protein